MKLYTYIMQFRGGTYISQVKANTLPESMINWVNDLEIREIKYFGDSSRRELLSKIVEEEPGKLSGFEKCLVFSFNPFNWINTC